MQALKLSIVILTSVLIPAPALAGILSTIGITQISTPTQGNLPTADTIQVFEETTDVAFPDGGIALNAGKIAPGTLVDSYNIYFDTESNSDSWKTASGSISFSSPIVGLIWSRRNLEASDALFGAAGVSYGGNWRGLESEDRQGLSDFFISGGGNTLDLSFNIRGTGYDELRVLTAAAPEPFTILGAATALGFGFFFKKRLSQKQK
ncbi:hypothetical protein NIES593_02045 [Hydrococcus rivularis NIES-593]|uniref:PEP-CTERM protein-sorting domain-containing protein n=1 Tax=Hydrococcus rivularis NIES-593 TaxID=1921803 RepID=A0A1U7HTC2_9CYAN|nr:PEP-CTERM sorting domain-containing protein [Hydrococcus rivularis]OKH26843.1 hypothetical protein NIES593_02045 [Hydrococcus rivularis NIES-593]